MDTGKSMVKGKRVSKKVSISPKPIEPVNIKPAVETLNIAPPVAKVEEPKIEHHAEKPPVIQPILKKSETKKLSFDPLKVTMIVVFSAIIIFWSLVLILSIHISTGPKQVEKNVTLIYYKPVSISLQRLIEVTDTANPIGTDILGYLRMNGSTMYMWDDYKNIIPVTVPPEEYGKLSNNSRQLYNISGTYRYSTDKFIFEINKLTPIKKPLIEMKEKTLSNITEGEKAGVKINLANGWLKISNAIM
jgi:hypothetical protein